MIDEPFMQMGKYAIVDPYPLVTDDAELWVKLLFTVYHKDRYLWGVLTWLRAVGASLEKTNNPNIPYKIVPIIGADGWQSQAEYDKEKQYLVPYTSLLIEVLQTL